MGLQLTLAQPGEAALATINRMIELMVKLNTAMLAAAGTLTVKHKDWMATWNHVDSYLMMAVFCCGAISYFGIYVAHTHLLSTIAQSAVVPLASELIFSFRLQYFGTLAGVGLLGLIFSRMLAARAADNTEQ